MWHADVPENSSVLGIISVKYPLSHTNYIDIICMGEGVLHADNTKHRRIYIRISVYKLAARY